MIDRTNETPGPGPYGPCGASAMHNEPPAFRYKGRTCRAESGPCLHCGRHVEIGRRESGATRPGDPAWHEDGDFGARRGAPVRPPLTSEGQTRVESHVGEARKIAAQAARRAPRCVPYADIYSAALGGLVEAAADYAPGPGPVPRAFAPFAHWRMRGAIRDYLRGLDFFPGRRRAGAAVAQSSLDDPARADGVSVGASLPSGDAEGAILADRAEAIEDARDRILAILEYLPDNHAGTLLDWLECPSGADCARRLGLSEATVSLRRKRALEAAQRIAARRIDR